MCTYRAADQVPDNATEDGTGDGIVGRKSGFALRLVVKQILVWPVRLILLCHKNTL
ncbi:hypothetical protein [Acidithiobacillus sp.]|uniref:hypothetical protein n=1 Tax=Acidithiobacillus sp. TaxID=1872118 RepID=UPI0025C3178E|nr:hypothetical protein [Acidithiobacillus sp.]